MPAFATIRLAKNFLIGRILEEAAHLGTPLSKVETKMLDYSEFHGTPHGTPQDWEAVGEAFALECDDSEYESRMAAIIRSYCKRSRKENPAEYKDWQDAVRMVKKEDHYLVVLIAIANGSLRAAGEPQGVTRYSRLPYLILIGLTIGVVVIAVGTVVAYVFGLLN